MAVVIDSGLARINRFDPRRGINVLLVEGVSQSSATQRAGRAGGVPLLAAGDAGVAADADVQVDDQGELLGQGFRRFLDLAHGLEGTK